MLKIVLSLLAVAAVLLVNEYLWRRKVLRGELRRKFIHIIVAAFVAFWPWLMSWRAIQLIGVAMVLVVLLNRQYKLLHFLGNIRENTYGEVFGALAVTTTALLSTNKVFFALALLHVALADSFAAIIGTWFGAKWRYKVFKQTKTVIGTMAFWIVSLCILGGGLLYAHDIIPFSHYSILVIALPPILTVIENFSVFGTDNLTVPVAVIIALRLAQVTT